MATNQIETNVDGTANIRAILQAKPAPIRSLCWSTEFLQLGQATAESQIKNRQNANKATKNTRVFNECVGRLE